MTLPGRPQLPEVPHQQPTIEDRRAGLVFRCPYCDLDWLKRDRHPHMGACINCGRRIRREREARRRHPEQNAQANARAEVVQLGDIEVDPIEFAHGRVPQDVRDAIDRAVEDAVAEVGAQSRRRARAPQTITAPLLPAETEKQKPRRRR